jgi:hypothetical protein
MYVQAGMQLVSGSSLAPDRVAGTRRSHGLDVCLICWTSPPLPWTSPLQLPSASALSLSLPRMLPSTLTLLLSTLLHLLHHCICPPQTTTPPALHCITSIRILLSLAWGLCITKIKPSSVNLHVCFRIHGVAVI